MFIFISFFLISNQVAMGLNVKNGLKVKQLAKQLPTLKTLMQKTSAIGLWVKNFTFSILNLLKLNFSTIFLARGNLIVYNIFRADTGNIRKIA